MCVCVCVCVLLSRVRFFAIQWTVARQAPLSMGFSRQEYQIGLPFPPLEDPPNSGIEPRSPVLQADSFTIWAAREAHSINTMLKGISLHINL